MKYRKAILGAVLVVVGGLSMTGCGFDAATEQFKDAPRTKVVNDSPADIIEMPDGFSNLASKCDGPNRVYVVFHHSGAYGSVSVVPNDPRCTHN